MKVHPVADLFPMLAEDELKELAADIKERGLLQPIVLDGPGPKGWLLDGRNRLAACEIAGVEPEFTYYDGSDPIGFILALNINRRHLTKGQQAMIAAMAFDSKELKSFDSKDQRDKDGSKQEAARIAGVSPARISLAVVVRDYAPDLVDGVIAGSPGLDEAYRIARERKTAADSVEAQLVRLRAEDPELADKVVEGELSLPGAWAELGERQRKRAEEQRDARALLTRIVDLAAPQGMSDEFGSAWAERLGDLDTELTALTKRAEQAGHVLLDLAERIRQ